MNVALIGTGLVGFPMSEKLAATGYSLTVFNRTPEKADPLKELGVEIADSPAAAVQAADWIILMLTDGDAIREALFSGQTPMDLQGKTILQMGTILPEESLQFQKEVEKLGGDYLEAPVLGSIPDVQEQRLLILIGGRQDQFHRSETLLRTFGSDLFWIGPVGQAAAVKLALNQLIVSETAAFSLSLGMVLGSGADPEMFMSVLRRSSLYAKTFDKKYHRMLERNFQNPNFPAKHLLKDLDLILQNARTHQLSTEMLSAIRNDLVKTIRAGFSEDDYSAMYNTIHPEK